MRKNHCLVLWLVVVLLAFGAVLACQSNDSESGRVGGGGEADDDGDDDDDSGNTDDDQADDDDDANDDDNDDDVNDDDLDDDDTESSGLPFRRAHSKWAARRGTKTVRPMKNLHTRSC
ncbi:MAG: hypothetical protein M5R36_16995 [Deltaproteobacteria bacterium]|nr:hypothetical protein [Deltaproteobacteria bacterium]